MTDSYIQVSLELLQGLEKNVLIFLDLRLWLIEKKTRSGKVQFFSPGALPQEEWETCPDCTAH